MRVKAQRTSASHHALDKPLSRRRQEPPMKKPRPFSLHDFDSLAQLRDELLLQTHLFKAEAKDRWELAEQRWDELRNQVHAARESIDKSSFEVTSATQLLFETLRDSYSDLRQALKR
jgi:hypothetical protein